MSLLSPRVQYKLTMGPMKEINEVGSNKAGREEQKERNAQRSGRGKLEETGIYLRLTTDKAVMQENPCIGEKWK
jgi:hypothetical protein